MLSNLWNFAKRHRRKFFVTGLVVGGGVLLWNYAQRKLQEYQEKEAAQCINMARRQHHFDSNQRTCNMTVLSMISSVRNRIIYLLDTESLTAQLKSNPSDKLEIWEELKILSFSRAVVSVYTGTLLVLYLRVQLSVLGGYMFVDSVLQRNGTTPELAVATPKVQQRYLEAVQYLLGQGLKDMCEEVRVVTDRLLKDTSLKRVVSLADLQMTLDSIRRSLEFCQFNGYHDGQTSSLCRFVMSEDTGLSEAAAGSVEERMLQRLLRETRDMVESADFTVVLVSCLDLSFASLFRVIATSFPDVTAMSPDDDSLPQCGLPLARLIPILSGSVNTVLADPPNQFFQDLLVKEEVKLLAANIYEAFSQTDQPPHQAVV